MKKQELIHLHGLLAEVRKQCEFWDNEMDLTMYEELGVKPTSIHKSKTDHKAAVFKLTAGITDSMDEATTEPLAPTADGVFYDGRPVRILRPPAASGSVDSDDAIFYVLRALGVEDSSWEAEDYVEIKII